MPAYDLPWISAIHNRSRRKPWRWHLWWRRHHVLRWLLIATSMLWCFMISGIQKWRDLVKNWRHDCRRSIRMCRVNLIFDILAEKESQKPNDMIERGLPNRTEPQALNLIWMSHMFWWCLLRPYPTQPYCLLGPIGLTGLNVVQRFTYRPPSLIHSFLNLLSSLYTPI